MPIAVVRSRPPVWRCGLGVVVALGLGTSCAKPPAPVVVATADPIVVPIEAYHNRVYLPARIDARVPVTLVLDNGASVSGVQDSAARLVGLKASGKASLTGNGQSVMSVALADDVTFDVGAAAIREPVVAILPYDEFARREGRMNGGVLGKDTYAHFVVDVDYAAHTLTLRDPSTFTYAGSGAVIRLHVRKNATGAWMSARLTMPGHAPVDARLGLDMGTYSALRLYTPFVKRRQLLGEFPRAVQSYGFGLGGEFPVTLARVQALDLGGVHIEGAVAELSTADAGATSRTDVDGTIGGAVLSRFRVIVDYAHARMILEPNERSGAPFAADMSGLVLDAGGPGFAAITVGHVIAGTPAAEAGIAVGDTLVSIDGENAGTLGLARVQQMLEREAAYRVTVSRRGSTIVVMLRTRPVI